MMTQEPSHREADYIDLHLLLRHIIKKRRIIIGTSLIVFMLAMAYAYFKPTLYQATLLLQIQQKEHKSLGAVSQNNQAANPENSLEEPLSVQIALMRSKFILGPVIKELGLDIIAKPTHFLPFYQLLFHDPDEIKVSQLNVASKYLNKKLRLVSNQDSFDIYDHDHLLLHGKLHELAQSKEIAIKVDNISAAPGTEFSIIKKPESQVINQMLTHLTILNLSNVNESLSNKLGLLQVSYTGHDAQMITKIANSIANVTQQKNISRKSLQANNKLAFLNQQLPAVRKSLQADEIKLNEYRYNTGKVDIKLRNHYLMSQLSAIDRELQTLRLKKTNLLQQYTAEYPYVLSITAKMQELMITRAQIYKQLKKLPVTDEAVETMKRNIEIKKSLYMALLNNINQLEVEKTGMISDINILVLATSPDIPVPIKLNIIGFSSILIGLLLGCLLAFGSQIFSRRLDYVTALGEK